MTNRSRQIRTLPSDLWHRLRSWRRIRFTRGGTIFTVSSIAVGMAAINTGNNLLYLLLGWMLGFIALSSWISEHALRGLEIRRLLPHGVTAGRPIRVRYRVSKMQGKFATIALELEEEAIDCTAFVPHLRRNESTLARVETTVERRGVYQLDRLTLSTSFPFGFFKKSRDIELRGELVVWPRTDRSVRLPGRSGQQTRRPMPALAGAPGMRGEYRSLREYRSGDDPRDIHWKSTARAGEPIVREYRDDGRDTLWVALDNSPPHGQAAEDAVEIAASLVARGLQEAWKVGLRTGDGQIPPGSGAGQLERILDALARVRFGSKGHIQEDSRDSTCTVTVRPEALRRTGGA